MTYGDVMKIEPSISLPVLLVGVIVGGNIAYQIGFYSSLGFQFISMTPLGDWLTVALALAPFYIAMALNSLAFLTVYRNAPHRRRILDRFIIQSERTLGRIAAAAFMVSLMVFNGSSRPQLWLTLISLFVAMALIPMQFVTFFSISLEDSEAFWRRVGYLVFSLWVGCFWYGKLQPPMYLPVCTIHAANEKLERVAYYRSVEGGHLIGVNRQAAFIADSEVKAISCERNAYGLLD